MSPLGWKNLSKQNLREISIKSSTQVDEMKWAWTVHAYQCVVVSNQTDKRKKDTAFCNYQTSKT